MDRRRDVHPIDATVPGGMEALGRAHKEGRVSRKIPEGWRLASYVIEIPGDDGEPSGYLLKVLVAVPGGPYDYITSVRGVAYAFDVQIQALDYSRPVSAAVLRRAAKAIEEAVDMAAAVADMELVTFWPLILYDDQGNVMYERPPNLVFEDGQQADEWVLDRQREYRRRRRSRLTDADYAQVAKAVNAAAEAGEPIQRAVMEALVVSQARAAELIREARSRGLLPESERSKRAAARADAPEVES